MRRAFARSDLHEAVLARVSVEHSDPARPRCKRWSWCEACGVVTPTWRMVVDHIDPVVPIGRHFSDMTLDEAAERMWCEPSNLQALCDSCHDTKTAAERELRPKKPRAPRKKKACSVR